MNIQELENKYKALGAEIERLKQAKSIWEPERRSLFWAINSRGEPIHTVSFEVKDTAHHTAYKTKELAKKASVLQLRSNLVIQACLNFDPDFVPDWSKGDEIKYGLYYHHGSQKWVFSRTCLSDDSAAYISTPAIADKVVAYLNSQEIK